MQKLEFFFNVIVLIDISITRNLLTLGEHSLEKSSLGLWSGDIPEPHIRRRRECGLSCTLDIFVIVALQVRR